MATRLDYRNRLKDKLVGLEDEGYGDFEFTDPELDTYMELAVARLYPSLYKRVAISTQAPTSYGSFGNGSITTDFADRVFYVEDAAELTPILGWRVAPGKVLGVNIQCAPSVNLYYTDAYVLPPNDTDDLGAPGIFTPIIVLGSLIEALESRHDTGVRGDPQPTGPHQEVSLIDRLMRRYDDLKNDIGMALPPVIS